MRSASDRPTCRGGLHHVVQAQSKGRPRGRRPPLRAEQQECVGRVAEGEERQNREIPRKPVAGAAAAAAAAGAAAERRRGRLADSDDEHATVSIPGITARAKSVRRSPATSRAARPGAAPRAAPHDPWRGGSRRRGRDRAARRRRSARRAARCARPCRCGRRSGSQHVPGAAASAISGRTRREPVARHHQRLAPRRAVGEPARDELEQGGGRFRDALDQAERRARPEAPAGRPAAAGRSSRWRVVQQADEAEDLLSVAEGSATPRIVTGPSRSPGPVDAMTAPPDAVS